MRAFLFFIFSCFAVSIAYAQDKNPAQKNDLDKLYTPDKNSIFNSKGNGQGNSYSELGINNVVKVNLALLVRSTAGLFWERKISNNVTLQPGVGVVVGKDVLMEYIGSEMNITPSPRSYYIVPFGELIKTGYFKGAGIFGSFSGRYYLGNSVNSETFRTGYFELNLRYSTMNLDIHKSSIDYNGYSSSNYYMPVSSVANFRTVSFYAIYGYQACTTGRIKTTHDFYFGGGFRSVSYSSYVKNENYPASNQSNQIVYVNAYMKSGRVSALIPSFVAGYSFGFGF
jgi:hypothetical protein